MSKMEKYSLLGTLVLTGLAIITAIYTMSNDDYFVLALSMGAIGGLLHEFAQSGGKILFFQKAKDGMYLGSISGMVLGAVAGIMLIKGLLPNLDDPTKDFNSYELAIDSFFAGLGLKGIAEAASGNIVAED
jgi:hypothetical protein